MGGSSRSLVQKYNPFEIVVNTNIAGDSGVGNFELKLDPTQSYRYYVDWGDGSTSASTTTTNLTHSYSVPGFYNVKVYGRFDAIYNNNTNEADKITDIISWGNVKWRDFYRAFQGCSNLTGGTTQPPILELMGSVNDMSSIFQGTSFEVDIGSWDVSNVNYTVSAFAQSNFNNGGSPSISGWTTSNLVNMSSMFQNNSNFNQPIGSWDVSNVVSLGGTFLFANSFNQDLGSWDVSNVVSLNNTFAQSNFNNGGSPSISGWTTSGVTTLRSTFQSSSFNQPIGSWDVTGVNNTFGFVDTFRSSPFNQDIGSWDLSNYNGFCISMFNASNFNNGGLPSISGWTTSGITSMAAMFQSTPFNQPIGSWDVSSVGSFGGMFNNANSFNQDLGSWDVSNSTNFSSMFLAATNFNNGGSPSISGWTFGTGVTNMSSMFYFSNFNQPIGSWDVSNVNNMQSMFNSTTNFNNGGSPSISGWTTSACTNMGQMFNSSSFNQPIGSWNTSNVTIMTGMFDSAQNFNQDIGSWDVSNVAVMNSSVFGMFRFASSFNNGGSPSISGWTFNTGMTDMRNMFRSTSFNQPIGSWDVSNVQLMNNMFQQTTSFNQNIGLWDVSKVTNMTSMFSNAPNFNNGGSPSISGWTTSACTNMSSMFFNATNFNQPIGSWDTSNVTNMSTMLFGLVNFNQDLSNWNVSGVTNMSSMLNNTAISITNYDKILTGWTGWNGVTATKTLQSNVALGASGLNYTSGSTAQDAHDYLVNTLGWTITDAGPI